MKISIRNSTAVLVAVFALAALGAQTASASTNYTVSVPSTGTIQRYIPSASFTSVEIAVHSGANTYDVWYIQAAGALDAITTAMITTPKANLVDFRLQCTNPVAVTNNTQVFYAGAGQNCAIQIDSN